MALPRDPLADPQRDDAFLCRIPHNTKVFVVHRRDEWVWFGGPDLPIRSARVDHFVQPLEMARARCMNDLGEAVLWPTPKHDASADGVPS